MAGTVYITKYEGQADWKVYFTDYEGEERNTELLRGCSLTSYENQASVTVYITDYESEATIVITRRNFPR